MTLNLNIDKLAGPGRLPAKVEVDYVRDLTEADLQIAATDPLGSVPPPIKQLKDRHHSLARLLAAGNSEQEAALLTGYDISRVSILKNSPAFQELLELYRQEASREFVTVIQHMAGMSRDALLELRQRIEDNPDRFTNNELIKIATDFTDRTVDRVLEDTGAPTVIELVAPDPSLTAEAAGSREEAD